MNVSRRELDADKEQIEKYNIPEFDIVIVDLYPFENKLNKKSNKLNRQNYIDLVASIKKILKLAIKKGGTSIKDFKTIDGKPG